MLSIVKPVNVRYRIREPEPIVIVALANLDCALIVPTDNATGAGAELKFT